MPIRAAMLDLDGTLVDTLGDFDYVLNKVLRDLGLPSISREAIRVRVGKGSEHLVRSVLEHIGADTGYYERAWQGYQREYLAINGSYSDVFPGVIEALQMMKARGMRLACLTNKPAMFVRPLLEAKHLLHFFDEIKGGDEFARKKPDPLPLVKTCEALGTAPVETLMIGDSINDALAARAAGCPIVLVTYGYNHGEPIRGVDADGYLDSLAEVGALLDFR